jgi:hypothetical protein
MKPSFEGQLPTRHGDKSNHSLGALMAHAFDLSAWQDVQEFGMPDCSDSAGEMKRKVWAAT